MQCFTAVQLLTLLQTLMHHENHQDQVSDDSTTTKKTILMEMRRRVKRTRLIDECQYHQLV